MPPYGDVGLILIHGVPTPGRDPFDSFVALEEALLAFFPPAHIFKYAWSAELKSMPVALARRGELGVKVAPNFGATFRDYRSSERARDISRWAIVCFSGGGWIVYQWLCGWLQNGILVRPTDEERGQVVFLTTIASPRQEVVGEVMLSAERSADVALWQLDEADILDAVRPGVLHVVYSPADRRVWPVNSAFTDRTHVHQRALDQAVDHDDVPLASGAIDFVTKHLQAVLGRVPCPAE